MIDAQPAVLRPSCSCAGLAASTCTSSNLHVMSKRLPALAETTYVFFGKRGSGKTTIRMEMQQAWGLWRLFCRGFNLMSRIEA